MGLGTVVIRSHPQPGIDLTDVKQSGESVGDAGDEYTGLDRFGRVVDQRWVATGTRTATDRFAYGYDRDGNRLFRDNLVNTGFGELYSYDGLNQLVSFDRGTLNGGRTAITGTVSRSQEWDYDALGNFDSVTTNGGSPQTRSANAQNEITSIGGATTPTYDANGNMTGDETGRTFVYDAWNRLVAVRSGGTTLETFSYDGLNRRVTNTVSGTTTTLFDSDQWQVLEEQVSGSTTARYVWSPVYVDALILRDRDTDANGTLDERLWPQQDANWNVTAIVDGTGAVAERNVYDAFGSITIYSPTYGTVRTTSTYGWTIGFQGMQYDSISGLNPQRERWYSPNLGTWTSLDPIRFDSGDVDLYGFVGNSPFGSTDASGLKPTKVRVNTLGVSYINLYGFFVWPVTYTLNDKANPCVGGWIVQHVMWTVHVQGQMRVKAEHKDYYEAWRIDPGKTETPKRYTMNDWITAFPASVQNEIAAQNVPINTRVKPADDWFIHRRVRPNSAGDISYSGTVFFIDGLSSLPASWKPGIRGGAPEAGGLMSVDASNIPATVGFFSSIALMSSTLIESPIAGVLKPSISVTSEHSISFSWGQDGLRKKDLKHVP